MGSGTVRYLKTLVTAMTVTTILGLLVLVAVVVVRFSQTSPDLTAAPALPDQIILPEGNKALAVTIGPDWYLVVTDKEKVLIFDTNSGDLLKSTDVRSK